MPDNRLWSSPDISELTEDPTVLAEVSALTTRERHAVGELVLRRLEAKGKPAPPRIRRWLNENGQSDRCRGRVTESRSSGGAVRVGAVRTFTESTVDVVGANPAARAAIRAMTPAARRQLAEDVNAVVGSRARTHTETASPPSPAPRQHRTPTEARELLMKEANDAAFHNGVSFTMAYITAAEAMPDLASDAGVDPAAIRRTHALPARA